MMNQTKSKLNPRPFESTGYDIETYVKWCNKHELKSYLNSSKKEFFKRINTFRITKRNNTIYEDGEEL